MHSFDHFTRALTENLSYVNSLGNVSTTAIQRAVKELEIGRTCYMAEEYLSDLELHMLKAMSGLSQKDWQTYKLLFSWSFADVE